MKLKEAAAKLSQEQQKKVEELNVQLFDEIDFEDTAPSRESPDAWRMLIYEEICADEKISQAKIDYRLAECGGSHSDVVFYACPWLISKLEKDMGSMHYNWRSNNNCIFDEALAVKNPYPENNA